MEESKMCDNSIEIVASKQQLLLIDDNSDNEMESNYFSDPKFDSVIDRYYTRIYKQIRPKDISIMLQKPIDN